MKTENPKLNGSGCKDLTAYEAIRPIIKSDKAIEKRVHALIDCVKSIIELAGFEVIGRIQIRDKKSGREYK